MMASETPAHGMTLLANGQECSTEENRNASRPCIYSSTPENAFQNGFTSPHISLAKKPVTLNLSLCGENNEFGKTNTSQTEKSFYKNPYFGSHFDDMSVVENSSDLQENVIIEEDHEVLFNSCRKLDLNGSDKMKYRCLASQDSGIGSQDSITPYSSSFKSYTNACELKVKQNFLDPTVSSLTRQASSSLKINTVQKDSLPEEVVCELTVTRRKQEDYSDLQLSDYSGNVSPYSCSPVPDTLPFLGLKKDVKMYCLDPEFCDSATNFSSGVSQKVDFTSDFSLSCDPTKETSTFDQMLLDSNDEDMEIDVTSNTSLYCNPVKDHYALEEMDYSLSCDPLKDSCMFSGLPTVFLDSTTTSPLLDDESIETSPKYDTKVNLLNQKPFSVRREKVDFLLLLGVERVHPEIIESILSYLDPRDLTAVAVVSKTWNRILKKNWNAYRRAQRYLEERQRNKENSGINKVKKLLSSTVHPSSRGNLREIQNLSNIDTRGNIAPNPRSPPVSPSKWRFFQFVKAGEKLENGKSLSPCPKCSLPSQVDSDSNVGQCTRKGCQYIFCTKCNCESHKSSSCPVRMVSSQRSRKRSGAICSLESKKNLRRL